MGEHSLGYMPSGPTIDYRLSEREVAMRKSSRIHDLVETALAELSLRPQMVRRGGAAEVLWVCGVSLSVLVLTPWSLVDCRSVRHLAQGVLAHILGRLPCPKKTPRKIWNPWRVAARHKQYRAFVVLLCS